jgi:3-dehydroquinate synthetase/quercetin dioxygenase-like cupin family protein
MVHGIEPGVVEDDAGFTLYAPDGWTYRVDISEAALAPTNPLLADYLADRRVCAFVSPTMDRLYGAQIRHYLEVRHSRDEWHLFVIPTSEQNKTMAAVERVCALAKQARLDRNGVMLAVGGGVVSDVVSFAASIYARGIRYMRLNTTLVGQVDVGVGVKTGVNGLGTKNMLGTYHPPHASVNDPVFLRTLPRREVLCGLSEIAKMAVIRDEKLFLDIEEYARLLALDPGHRFASAGRVAGGGTTGDGRTADVENSLVRTSMRLMLRELWPNLRETNLARAVDFGHTFSSAIETASGYRLAHGEAVAVDMAISATIAQMLGICSADDRDRIVDLLTDLGLPVFDRATCRPELMRTALTSAWERRGRHLNLVVPTTVGDFTFIRDLADVPDPVLVEALARLDRRNTDHSGASMPSHHSGQTEPTSSMSANPLATPPEVVRHQVAHLDHDLMRKVYADHGGDGHIFAHRAFDDATNPGRVAFIDLVTVPAGSSIGLHRHGDDEETYVILEGGGVMTLDGHEFRVQARDVIVNRPFGEHGLRNDSSEVLQLLVYEIRPGLPDGPTP